MTLQVPTLWRQTTQTLHSTQTPIYAQVAILGCLELGAVGRLGLEGHILGPGTKPDVGCHRGKLVEQEEDHEQYSEP